MRKIAIIFLTIMPLLSCGLSESPADIKDNATSTESPSGTPGRMKGMLERHNYWRKQVGVAPLEWSEELAAYAMEWAVELKKNNNCQIKHRPDKGNFAQKYGENIFWSSGTQQSAEKVTDSWAAELKDWNTETLECNKEWQHCGHYTQLVWYSSKKLGCAMIECSGGQEIWVCNYNPPGNWVGEKPYTKG